MAEHAGGFSGGTGAEEDFPKTVENDSSNLSRDETNPEGITFEMANQENQTYQFNHSSHHNMSNTFGSLHNGRISIIKNPLDEMRKAATMTRRSDLLQGTPAGKYFSRAEDVTSSQDTPYKEVIHDDMVRLPMELSNDSNSRDGPPQQHKYNEDLISGSSDKNLFERGHESQSQQSNLMPLKLTSIKELLRIFRVNLNEDNSFSVNGQQYLIDFVQKPQENQPYQKQGSSVSGYFPQYNNENQFRATFGNAKGVHEQHLQPQTDEQDGFERSRSEFLDDFLLSKGEASPSSVTNKFRNSIYRPNFGHLQIIPAEQCESESPATIRQAFNQNSAKIERLQQAEFTWVSPKCLSPSDLMSSTTLLGSTNTKQLKGLNTSHSTLERNPSYTSGGFGLYPVASADTAAEIANQERLILEISRQCALQVNKEEEEEEGKMMAQQKNLNKAVSAMEGFKSFKQPNISPQFLSADSLISSSGHSNLPQPNFKRVLSMNDRGKMHIEKQISEKFLNLESENQRLNKENKQMLQKLRSVYIGGETRNLQDCDLHLAFLFATPLVVNKGAHYSGNSGKSFKEIYKPQPLLEFKQEFSKIRQSIKRCGRNVKICSMQATVDNLTKILGKKPLALHFTGHGFENKMASRKIEKSLLLEHYDGDSVEVNEQLLQEIIKSSKVELEFVFVASCYSEFAGRIFQNMGVKHVIVVKQGNVIADQAVILFSDTFYELVFGQQQTICSSFELAKQVVVSSFGKEEASKFIMLEATELQNTKLREEAAKRAAAKKQNLSSDQQAPQKKKRRKLNKLMPDIEDDEEFNVQLPEEFGIDLNKIPNDAKSLQNQKEAKIKQDEVEEKFQELKHECKIFGPFEKGEMQNLDLDLEPKFKEIPSFVDNFIGRQVELFEVVHNVRLHRLVNIIGTPGIGKTALAKNAVHYMQDRLMFKLGIVFFSLKGYKNSNVFMKKLVTNMIISSMELKPEEKADIHESNQETITQKIISYFREQEDKLLVVFDNAEELLFHDYKGFIQIITQLLSECNNLHFLLTSRSVVGVLQDVQEKIIILQELESHYAVDLFLLRARPIDEQEKIDLITYQPDKVLPTGELNRYDQKKIDFNFANHHLFKLLAGNPHAIILAAPLLINKRRLKDLYILLNSDNLTENLKVDGVTDSTVTSICLSIEASIIILEQEDSYAHQFFYLIGLLPGGIFKDELNGLWKKTATSDQGSEHHIDTLMKMSLLQLKEQAGDIGQQNQKLILPPFINNFAEQTIDAKLKTKFQNLLCRYYAQKCKELYKKDFKDWKTSNQKDSNANQERSIIEREFITQLRSELIRYETNIWACIYRMAKTDQPIEFDQLDLMALGFSKGGTQSPNNVGNQNRKNSGFRRNSTQILKTGGLTQFKVKTIRKSSSDLNQGDMSALPQLILDRKIKSAGEIIRMAKLENKKDLPFSAIDEETSQMHDAYSEMSDFIKNSDFGKPNEQANVINPVIEIEADKSSSEQTIEDIGGDDINDYFENLEIEAKEAKATSSNPPSFKRRVLDAFTEKVGTIIRNSIVNFRRSSTLMKRPAQEEVKSYNPSGASSDTEDDIYMMQKSFSQQTVQGFALAPTMSTPDSHRRSSKMNESETLVIYYGMNLYLIRDDDIAIKLINSINYVKECKEIKEINLSPIFDANIQRLLGLIYMRKLEINEAMSAFNNALDIYKKLQSIYGQALCHFSIGIILQSNSSQLLNTSKTDVINMTTPDTNNSLKKAKKHFKNALDLFKQCNHKVAQAQCHEHLSSIFMKLNQENKQNEHINEKFKIDKEYSTFIHSKSRKRCPYVHRVYGKDISIMSEVVADNENRDLFPELPQTNQISYLKMDKKSHSVFNMAEANIQPEVSSLGLAHQYSLPPLHNNQDNYSAPTNNMPSDQAYFNNSPFLSSGFQTIKEEEKGEYVNIQIAQNIPPLSPIIIKHQNINRSGTQSDDRRDKNLYEPLTFKQKVKSKLSISFGKEAMPKTPPPKTPMSKNDSTGEKKSAFSIIEQSIGVGKGLYNKFMQPRKKTMDDIM